MAGKYIITFIDTKTYIESIDTSIGKIYYSPYTKCVHVNWLRREMENEQINSVEIFLEIFNYFFDFMQVKLLRNARIFFETAYIDENETEIVLRLKKRHENNPTARLICSFINFRFSIRLKMAAFMSINMNQQSTTMDNFHIPIGSNQRESNHREEVHNINVNAVESKRTNDIICGRVNDGKDNENDADTMFSTTTSNTDSDEYYNNVKNSDNQNRLVQFDDYDDDDDDDIDRQTITSSLLNNVKHMKFSDDKSKSTTLTKNDDDGQSLTSSFLNDFKQIATYSENSLE